MTEQAYGLPPRLSEKDLERGFQNRVQQEETGAISSTTIFRQPFEAQHTAEVPKLLSTSLDGSSNFDLDSTQTTGNFLQRQGEAQCTVKGKTFTARSAEQFRVGASNCLAHDKGLQDESQRTQGKSLASRGCWGGGSLSQQTSPLGLSQQTQDMRREQVRESEEDAIKAWSQVPMHLASWSAMAGLCARKILDHTWDHESLLVSWVEELEKTSQEGTLASWILEKACDATTMEDNDPETWFRLLRAAEDVALSTRKAKKARQISVLSANVSSWRAEHRQWLVNQGPEIALIQETHWSDSALAKETIAMAKLGYEVFAQPCPTRKQPVGGCAVLVKSHIKGAALHHYQDSSTGCGFNAVMARFAGTNVVFISIYLQTGSFIDGEVNAKILAELKSFLATLRCPWFAAGDWNSDLQEVLGTRLNEVLKGQFLGIGKGTAGGTNELDYALIHPALHRLVHIREEWAVPFRPHCALLFSWQMTSTSDLVPGLRAFQEDFEKISHEQKQEVFPVIVPEQIRMLEFLVDDESSRRCAAFSATAEAHGILGDAQERGVSCPVRRTNLIGTPVKQHSWYGKTHAFWARWATWLQSQHLPPTQVMTDALVNCPDDSWASLCQEWLCDRENSSLKETLLEKAITSEKETQKSQNAKNKEDFLAWILGADKAGLGPVYKSVKSQEQTTLRPYRDRTLLCRAYLRMEFWAHIWDGSLLKRKVEQTPSRARLKAEAQEQAAVLPPLSWEEVRDACHCTGNKKGGIDGWSYKALRNLTDQGYQMLCDLYHEMEAQVSVPFQFQVVQVALLPKTEAKERPISLTSVLWRVWTKLRRSSLAKWLEGYSQRSGFDSAVPGHTSLDPALARLIRAEDHKFRGQTFITLFCDLEGFYDVVSHERLVHQSLALGFPSLITELAIQIYEGPRCLYGEGVASPSIWPKRGLLQGCPCAPTLAKLTTYQPLTTIKKKAGVSHADLWLDDISVDIAHPDAEVAATLGVDVFRTLRSLLHSEGLELNMSKTKFVVNNAKSRKALQSMCGQDMPAVADLVKDLGLDSAGAKRRRVTTALKRFKICMSRNEKLRKFHLARRKRTRIFNASPLAAGLYGHQGQGVAPKRLKVVRAALARHAGRSQLGSTDVILDLMSHLVQDPLLKVVQEQADALFRAFIHISPEGSRILLRTWKVAWKRQSSAIHGWKTVAGPVAAMCQYCLDLQIDASNPLLWKCRSRQLRIDFECPTCSHKIRRFLAEAVNDFRAAKMGSVTTADGAADGVDWTIPRRLLKSSRTKKTRHAYRAVWQGQVLHNGNGGVAICKCGAERTLQHVMYECPLAKKYKLSPAALALRKRCPQPCFWLRGIVPSSWTNLAVKAEKLRLERTGLFEGEIPEVADLVVATDASGGPYSKDPRLRAVGWAVIIARRQGQSIEVLGTLSGVLMPPATVPQGEHIAIIEAIRHTSGKMDLTTDCKGTLKTLKSAHPHKKCIPEWGDVWHQKDRVKATWVRAHQSAEVFEKEFPQQEWRRLLNIAADELSGLRAREALSPHSARKVHDIDRIATEVMDHLASRAEWQLQNKENEYVPRAVRESLSQFDKSQKPHSKAVYMNKRSRLKQMLAESSQGHTWRYTRGEEAINLQLKCEVCGLWVQQTYSQDAFQKVDAQPCIGQPSQGPRFWPELHPTHTWQSTGKTWECTGCGVGFGPAAKVPSKATKVCPKTLHVAKLCFGKTSLSRTEALSVNPEQLSEVSVPTDTVSRNTPHLKAQQGSIVEGAQISPKPQSGIQAGTRGLFTRLSTESYQETSSSGTENKRPSSSQSSHEVTVPAKAKPFQAPLVFGFTGPPPKSKACSPLGPEGQAGSFPISENLKPKTPLDTQELRPSLNPESRQTRLVFAASGSTDQNASQTGG